MRRMVAGCVVLTACIQLTAGGKQVKYVERDSGRFAQCERLPQTFQFADVSRDMAVIKLRNAIGAAGGTHANVLETRALASAAFVGSVEIRAEGYRCAEDAGGLGGRATATYRRKVGR